MGVKVYTVKNTEGQLLGYSHHCPGCGHSHVFYTTKEANYHCTWTFDGNMEKPTFKASMLVNPKNDPTYHRCHYFVTKGKIKYLKDCTHELKGQTVEMNDVK